MDNSKNIKTQLIGYLQKVKAQIPISRVYLVGSWVKGEAHEGSDVDLLVLSKAFEKMDTDERLKVLYRNTVGIDFDLHIHAVTPSEYKAASKLNSLGMMKAEKKLLLKI